MKKIFVINLGATSTKLAYYEDESCVAQESIVHSTHELSALDTLADQVPLRMAAVQNWASEEGIDFTQMDAVVSRGGVTRGVPGGVIAINEAMVEEALSGKYGVHPCSIGVKIAYDLTRDTGALAVVVDSPVTDELEDIARFSGLAEVERSPKCQALNAKAVAKDFAHKQGKTIKDINLVVATMGGGTSVLALKQGRIIDTNDGVLGEGPFATNRCGGVPLGPIIDMCYSGAYTRDEMMHHINGDAGFISYLGTGDMHKIEERIAEGDGRARSVLDAFCYQVAKDIGAMATVLEGDVDAVVLSGGMAHSEFVVEHISQRIDFIAPVLVYPGGDEMAALWLGAWEALNGTVPICDFISENTTAKALAEDLGIDNPEMVSDQGPAAVVGSTGTVVSVNISEKKGTRKAPVDRIDLVTDFGVARDAHAGDWHRQVSFLAEESIQVARDAGLDVGPGDFAENITTQGINIKDMPLGTRLAVGSAVVVVSQIGKVCHTRCAIYYLAGDCIFPREGVFAWVAEPGQVRAGDEIRVLEIGNGVVGRAVSDKPASHDTELIDLYDAQRNPLGMTIPRAGAQLAPGEYMLYVLAVIQDAQGNYLIVQRSAEKNWAPLSWEMPGGGVAAGETPDQAIIREVREELGLDVAGLAAEPFHSYESVDAERGDNYFVDMYRFILDVDKSAVVLQESEAIDCAFVGWDDICNLAEQGSFLHFERLQKALATSPA